jgi:hypothetical protein
MIELDVMIYDEPLVVEWLIACIDRERITVVRKQQADGSWKFAVYNNCDRRCLSREGEWCYESLPSNRPDDWYETHRFPTFEEAVAAARPAAEAVLKETTERVAMMNAAMEKKT